MLRAMDGGKAKLMRTWAKPVGRLRDRKGNESRNVWRQESKRKKKEPLRY